MRRTPVYRSESAIASRSGKRARTQVHRSELRLPTNNTHLRTGSAHAFCGHSAVDAALVVPLVLEPFPNRSIAEALGAQSCHPGRDGDLGGRRSCSWSCSIQWCSRWRYGLAMRGEHPGDDGLIDAPTPECCTGGNIVEDPLGGEVRTGCAIGNLSTNRRLGEFVRVGLRGGLRDCRGCGSRRRWAWWLVCGG